MDQAHWPEMKERFAAVFATRTRDEWMAVFEGSDACVAPVLTMHEAKDHRITVRGDVRRARWRPPARARSALQPYAGSDHSPTVAPPGSNTDEGLAGWGLSEDAIEALRDAGALGETP